MTVEPIPDAEPLDAWDSEYINDVNEAWKAFHPGEELPEDAITTAPPSG